MNPIRKLFDSRRSHSAALRSAVGARARCFRPGDGLGERISLSLFDRSREANRIPAASFFDEGFGGSSGAFFGLVIA